MQQEPDSSWIQLGNSPNLRLAAARGQVLGAGEMRAGRMPFGNLRSPCAHPLFLGEPDRLRDKLAGATGLLARYWADYRERLLQDPGRRPHLVFLPALLTGEGLEDARSAILECGRRLAQEDAAGDVQFHTWCRSGTVIRQAVYFDWLASRQAWSRAETEEAAEAFLGFAFKHAYPVLTSRTRTCNNQPLAMALNCAVLGYVFGCKHADHPTGRFLFEYGTQRILDLLGLFPQDGYGGEGSTYTSLVNTPLAFWIAGFLSETLAGDWIDRPFPPNGATLRRIVEMEQRLVSPGGLMPPWDHYGWQKPANASPFAYLARVTGSPEYLAMIPAFNLWEAGGGLAWGHDDPLWTLVWWPEAFKTYANTQPPAERFGWFLPRTGAALDDPQRRARLMQVWDACADGISGLCRMQSNPNHLMFDYAGEPVFQDGVEAKDAHPWSFSEDEVFAALTDEQRSRYTRYVLGNGTSTDGLQSLLTTVSTGLTGAANAVVVDEEPWHWPGRRCVGRADGYVRTAGLQAVSADCAEFYHSRYDIGQARRTSAWSTALGFGVVLDSLKSARSHAWRWQVHLRPDTTLEGRTARVNLPGGRHVLLAWEAGPTVRLTSLPGFPRTEEGASARLELCLQGPQAEFTLLIAPDAQAASIRRLSPTRIEAVIDGVRHPLEIPLQPVAAVRDDVHELPDLDADASVPFPDVDAALHALAWGSSPPAHSPAGKAGLLSALDACLAQIAAPTASEQILMAALEHTRWPVRAAAADVLGRRGARQAIPVLRRMLEAEHALPTAVLYPDANTPSDGRSTEDLGKRWRLKAALIVALGRFRDGETVPLLRRLFTDGHDFHAVYSVAAQALGRIGGPDALEVLHLAQAEQEHNTSLRVRAAIENLERKR